MRAPRRSVAALVLFLSAVLGTYSSSVVLAEEDQKVQVADDTTTVAHEPHVEANAATADDDDHVMPVEEEGEGEEVIPPDADTSTGDAVGACQSTNV